MPVLIRCIAATIQALRNRGICGQQVGATQGNPYVAAVRADSLDRLTALAAKLLNVPIALISLVDSERQWFKSCVGLDARETPRNISFCGHAVYEKKVLAVPDATLDERFADNPLVTGAPFIAHSAMSRLRR